jgi:inner membrane transporter RhtA
MEALPSHLGAPMSSRSTTAPLALALVALLISMLSYQCGTLLAKHLFPQVGALGAARIESH